MTEDQVLLADTAEALLGRLGPASTVALDWAEVEASGLTSLLVAEADGGFGGGWAEARLVFGLAGKYAVALPVVEASLALSLAPPGTSGLGSVATATDGRLEGGTFSGRLLQVPWGREASFVIAQVADETVMLGRPSSLTPGENPAGEPRDVLAYVAAPATRVATTDLLGLCAAARVAQIAGALDAALAQAADYTNTRKQFGRPLAKFQAVQQSLAQFATEAAAANAVALGVFQALDRDDAGYEIAAAKLRANMAAGLGASVAHQVHGAIGFTREHSLHPLTRRLWSWRSEYGSDQYWAARLGARIGSRGADVFWSDMSARTDAA